MSRVTDTSVSSTRISLNNGNHKVHQTNTENGSAGKKKNQIKSDNYCKRLVVKCLYLLSMNVQYISNLVKELVCYSSDLEVCHFGVSIKLIFDKNPLHLQNNIKNLPNLTLKSDE